MNEKIQIEEILEREGKKAKIRVSGRAFHPSGGGQPGDSGRLESEGFEAEVLDCRSGGDGYVLDIVVKKGEVPVGRPVFAAIDSERNRRLSRMHTGEHVLSRILENQLPGLAVQKVSIGEKESSVFMTYPGDIGWDDLFRAEEGANKVIAADLPVGVKKVSRERADGFEGVKIKWDRIDEKEVTIVTIGEFDSMACSGTHVGSTAEVGGLIVTGFKGGNGEWEVKFTVDRQETLQRHSRITRMLSREIGCEEGDLPSVVAKLREERREATRKLDKARRYLEIPWEDIGRMSGKLYFFAIENFPLELASTGVKKKIEKETGCVVGFLSQEQSGEALFILAAGKDLGVDLKGLLAKADTLQARGGGTADWVQGRAGNGSPSEWKKVLLSIVDK
ncbi:MAG TPA: alanyl-tRNA editing protein [Synergistales bacterium]|nr:alanyl-tRNA editing protein [Synergistales bacterium]HPC75278.1 alanyl-tRNA editing protein [Synergistales bacterium]HRS48286.1 alanyl-tRNA editing protein [Thermovirgaceae bacterium]HRU90521.1 alanyl-tRNA editing protein [Thermovirgaceae bacterium]